MHLSRLVETSAAVAATRARTRKRALLGELLADAGDQRPLAVAYLTGTLPQGRIGVGWATVRGLDADPAAAATLTLRDVDAVLDRVADLTGPGSRERRLRELTALMARATAGEQNLLRRLLQGELRHGALDGVMVEAIAAAAEVDPAAVRRAYMLSDDLPAVAAAAFDGGADALAAFRLRLLQPVQPMLAQTAADVDDALTDGAPAVIDAKIDGMRVQVHRESERVRVFTRSLRDVTADLPAVADAVAALPTTRVILDGEAVRMDGERPARFQETMADGDRPLVARFFDCLHVDGSDLIDLPLRTRLDTLADVLDAHQQVRRVVTEDPAVAAQFFDEVVASGYEGVVVKDPEAPYEAGRRGAAWRKVKPSHTLDLVVLAAEWGSGRRRGWLSNLHLGARDPDGGFVMLGKTFKGLTDETLAWQTEQLLAREQRRDGHIVHVTPDLVVEIAIDGVQTSPRYPGGMALRFARVKRYRPDKTADQADTVDTVRAIHHGR